MKNRSDPHLRTLETIIKGKFFNIFFEKFDKTPNRISSEFKETYKTQEPIAYANRYESIRSASFNLNEKITFDKNIAEQTEKHRQLSIVS